MLGFRNILDSSNNYRTIIIKIVGVNLATFFLCLQFLHNWKYILAGKITTSLQVQTYLKY